MISPTLSNYVYDAIGNLIKDKAEGIDSIKWNVYGKIMSIHKSSGVNIWYTYDAGGNRISKKVKNGTDSTYTWYARDASGNALSVYRIKNDTTYQDELHLYGSTRIGMIRPERNLILAKQYGDSSGTLTFVGSWRGNVYRRGQKFFELANHLGNVLVTITDKKLGIDGNTDGNVDYYMPDVMTANDYYPFGMGMPERKFSLSNVYRYGFNGKENDNDVKGEGNQQDYGMRIYDPRVGMFLSLDPLTKQYPFYSPYHFAGNSPIKNIDLDGAEPAGNPRDWKILQGGTRFTREIIHNGNQVTATVKQYRVQDKNGWKGWVNEENWNNQYHGLWSNYSNFQYFDEDPSVCLPKLDKARWKPFETSYQSFQRVNSSVADGIGISAFGGAVIGTGLPALSVIAPSVAQGAVTAGRTVWAGIKSEAALLKYVPKEYLTYAKVFGANLGLQVAFNGKDADVGDAALSTYNPILGLLINPLVDYKPAKGHLLPRLSTDKPENMAKNFLVSSIFTVLGMTYKYSPSGLSPNKDYIINTAESTANKIIPNPLPEDKDH